MEGLTTDWLLVSLSPVPAAWLWALCGAIALAVLWVSIHYRAAPRRWSLITLRVLAGTVVALMLIEPAIQVRTVRRKPDRVVMVLDRSTSMTLKVAHQGRYDHLLKVLREAQPGMAELAKRHRIEWYDLDGAVSQAGLARPPQGEASDLLAALEGARRGGQLPLAGVVLLSDGADTEGLATVETSLSDSARQRLAAIGAPVNTVDVSAGHAFRDISLAEVLADEFAFVHNTMRVEVHLRGTGFPNAVLPLTLKRDGKFIESQEVQLRSADEEGQPQHASVVFGFKPDSIGEFVYSVEIPALAGDAVPENNSRTFVVQVVRDKIRVLHVSGRPSWDERFLRQHLKENPNVDLVSFFILRTPQDDAGVDPRGLSLIRFPTQELFNEKLPSFDVIVFQNFDYRQYNMAQYLGNIASAVRGGLGFVMIGGEGSFGAAYSGTAIEEVLPLVPADLGMHYGKVRPGLTEAGEHHPVTKLGLANTSLWRRMPAWRSVNLTLGLSPTATALVVDPQRSLPGGGALPLIAVREVEKGRSLAIASPSMWRWRFAPGVLAGPSERAYHRFWSNALRWLMRDPEHRRVQVAPHRRRFVIGEEVSLDVRVLAEDYRPVAGAAVRLKISIQLDGATSGTESTRVVDGKTDETGLWRYVAAAGDLKEGAYSVEAEAFAQGKALGKGGAVFIVSLASKEKSGGAPRADVLRRIAAAGGGVALPLTADFPQRVELADPGVVEVSRRRNIEVWDNGFALLLAVALLAGEWALRRRRGYL